jgi:hypothetical protein
VIINLDDFVLVCLHSDDGLRCYGITAHDYEVLAFQAHKKIHFAIRSKMDEDTMAIGDQNSGLGLVDRLRV